MLVDVSISPYGPTKTDQANAMRVDVGDLTLWFSYRTIVAFQAMGKPIVVRQNEWESTTGRHLNAIDGGDKASRVSAEAFGKLLDEALSKYQSV